MNQRQDAPPKGHFSNLKTALVDAYFDSIPLISLNVIWFFLTIPLITAFPAAAGLYYATNQLAHQRSAGVGTFVEGFRKYLWLSLRWGILNLLVIFLFAFNIWFYTSIEAGWAFWAAGLTIGIIVIWLSLQVYTFPLLLEQEQPSLVLAIRNSAVLYARRPGYSLGIAAILLVLALISTFLFPPAWGLITASLGTYLANRATVDSLGRIEKSQTPPDS